MIAEKTQVRECVDCAMKDDMKDLEEMGHTTLLILKRSHAGQTLTVLLYPISLSAK